MSNLTKTASTSSDEGELDIVSKIVLGLLVLSLCILAGFLWFNADKPAKVYLTIEEKMVKFDGDTDYDQRCVGRIMNPVVNDIGDKRGKRSRRKMNRTLDIIEQQCKI